MFKPYPKKKKATSSSRLTSSNFYANTAWKWFSKYILLLNSKNGIAKCATCGTMKRINDKTMHLGHLIKVFNSGGSTNFNTAFDERNVLPQCHKCNCYQGGRELDMMEAINSKHGENTYNELKAKSKLWFKLDKVVLKLISDTYRHKFNELAKEKGNPWNKK